MSFFFQPEQISLEAINNRNKNTMCDWLGIEFCELGEDFLVAKMPVDHRTIQPLGVVNGGKIYVKQLDDAVKNAVASGATDSPELRKSIADELVVREAILQDLKKTGLATNSENDFKVKFAQQNVLIDHAKLWVISSNPSHFNLPNVVWHDLRREMVPSDYQGNRDCAKFFTIGSGFAQGELKGELNNEDDREEPLWGAKKVDSNCNPVSLWEKIQSSNVILGKNYAKVLQRSTDFPEEFNDWGFKRE